MTTNTSAHVLATVETTNFAFQALARTREEADALLLKAWARHCREYRHAQPDGGLMADMVEGGEVNYVHIRVGDVTRDGEVL